MLTQCPSCHARTTLSGDHAGAKVRCAECGRLFVARPSAGKNGWRARTGLWVGALVGALALIVLALLFRSGAPWA